MLKKTNTFIRKSRKQISDIVSGACKEYIVFWGWLVVWALPLPQSESYMLNKFFLQVRFSLLVLNSCRTKYLFFFASNLETFWQLSLRHSHYLRAHDKENASSLTTNGERPNSLYDQRPRKLYTRFALLLGRGSRGRYSSCHQLHLKAVVHSSFFRTATQNLAIRTRDAKLVLSFLILKKYLELDDPLRSLIVLRVLPLMSSISSLA